MPIDKEIREALDKAMSAGRTSEEIGRVAGVHPVTLRKFRSGNKGVRSLSGEYLEKIAVALGLQIKVVPMDRAKTKKK